AEEWAVVDNLSRGRVGISVASGWVANDFVFQPDRFADRRRVLRESLEQLRKLWRGEAVERPDGRGKPGAARVRRRPVQPELPVWLTAAASLETFRQAGELGAGVLTHLLGQSVDELAGKIAIYREAWRRAGHGPGRGHVALMLHTFVGTDAEAVRET